MLVRYGGRGRPVVIIHDAGQSSAAAQRHGFLEHLAADFRVTAPDLPGHGGSPPVADPTIEQIATAILATLEALGDERFDLVGIGVGAAIALTIAGRRPGGVRSIVAGLPTRPDWRDLPPTQEDGRHLTASYQAIRSGMPAGAAIEATALTIEAAEAGSSAIEAEGLLARFEWEEALEATSVPLLLGCALGSRWIDRLGEQADRQANLDLAILPGGPLFGAFDPGPLVAIVREYLW